MLSSSTTGLLLVLESVGLAATLSMLGVAIYLTRRANRELRYARKKAEDARLAFKRLFRDLDPTL